MTINPADLIVVTETDRAKILRDRTRSKILHFLSEKPLTIKQLSTKTGKTPPTILFHIRKLEQHGFVELLETKKVKNYIEKYYKSAIPKSTEILVAAPISLSKRKLRELQSEPQFFKGRKFWVSEEKWKDGAHHFFSKLGMADLNEEQQRDTLRLILELLDLAVQRTETILRGLLQELEDNSPKPTRETRRHLIKYSSTIVTYIIDNDEFLGKLRAIIHSK